MNLYALFLNINTRLLRFVSLTSCSKTILVFFFFLHTQPEQSIYIALLYANLYNYIYFKAARWTQAANCW